MKSGHRSLILLALLASQLMLVVLLGVDPSRSTEALRAEHLAMARDFGSDPVLALIEFFLVYVASSVLMLPGSALLSLTAGAVFGMAMGTLIASLGSSLGALLAFLAFRVLLSDWLRRRGPAGPIALLDAIDRLSVVWLVAARLIPFLPFFGINAVFGLTRMRASTFFFVSWLAMLPGTIAYVRLGVEFSRIEARDAILSPAQLLSSPALWALTLAGVAVIAIGWRASRRPR